MKIAWLEQLRSPYYFTSSYAIRWRNCALFSAFVFFFLYIFRPFDLGSLEKNILPVTLGYGLTCFLIMALLNVGIVRIFPSCFTEKSWTLAKELGWVMGNILLIGIGNWLYSNAIGFWGISFSSLLRLEAYTLAIGVFPVGIVLLLKQNRMKNHFEQQSSQLNTYLRKETEEIQGMVTIPSEKLEEDFRLFSSDLIFMRSADNYVEVFYRNGQEVGVKMIRGTLKMIDLALDGHPQFFRCHKSYLVNLDHISHVSGNAQGLKLHLKTGGEIVPVSRTHNAFVKKVFTRHSTKKL